MTMESISRERPTLTKEIHALSSGWDELKKSYTENTHSYSQQHDFEQKNMLLHTV